MNSMLDGKAIALGNSPSVLLRELGMEEEIFVFHQRGLEVLAAKPLRLDELDRYVRAHETIHLLRKIGNQLRSLCLVDLHGYHYLCVNLFFDDTDGTWNFSVRQNGLTRGFVVDTLALRQAGCLLLSAAESPIIGTLPLSEP